MEEHFQESFNLILLLFIITWINNSCHASTTNYQYEDYYDDDYYDQSSIKTTVTTTTTTTTQRGRTVRYLTSSPIVIAPSANHTATLIFLHSVDDSGFTFSRTVRHFQRPYIKILLPTAMAIPITKEKKLRMRAWYDFTDYSYRINDTKPLEATTKYVHQLIKKEIEENGIPPERIILSGFAQGAAMAMHAAFTFSHRLGGVMAFSSWPWPPDPFRYRFEINQANKEVPFLNCKSAEQRIVNCLPKEMIFEASFDLEEHGISQKQMDEIHDFLKKHLENGHK